MRSILIGLCTLAVPATLMLHMHWQLRRYERREERSRALRDRRIFRHDED
jgi:hypothetical protein